MKIDPFELARAIRAACEAGEIELADALCVVGQRFLSADDWAWVEKATE